MEVTSDWGVYIPDEAEVKNVPLKKLPSSVLRRLGLSDSSRNPTGSSDVTWICPVVVKRKGQESASLRGSREAENGLRLRASEVQASPLKMSFDFSDLAVRDLLMDVFAGKCPPENALVREDRAPPAKQNAVLVYNGLTYLWARTKKHKTGKLRPTCQAAAPSASGQQPTAQTKEFVGGSQKVKADAALKAKRCEKAELKRKDVSSVRAECSAPRRCGGGRTEACNSQGVKAARRESASEDAEPQPSFVQQQEEQEHPTSRGRPAHEEDASDLEDGSVWTSGSERHQVDGERGWMSAASASKHTDFDFTELEQEERIAQLTAQFLQNKAALNNLLS